MKPPIIKNKKGDLQIRVDEEPLKFNEEKIKLLKPAFNKEGSITPANASSLNDGAASVLLASKDIVDKFHSIGLENGGKDEGKPGPRHGNDYYAYVRDLDGNKICAFTNNK